jgi:hypothetical protein
MPGEWGTERRRRVKQNQRLNKKVKTPTLPKPREEWGTQKAWKLEAKSKAKDEGKGQMRNTRRVPVVGVGHYARPSRKTGRVGHPEKIRA